MYGAYMVRWFISSKHLLYAKDPPSVMVKDIKDSVKDTLGISASFTGIHVSSLYIKL